MNPYRGAQRTRLEYLDPLHSAELLAFLLVGFVDIPGGPLAGLVDVGPQLVAASFEDVPSHRFVEHPLESTIRSDVYPQELVLEYRAASRSLSVNLGRGFGCAFASSDEERGPAQSGDAATRVVNEESLCGQLDGNGFSACVRDYCFPVESRQHYGEHPGRKTGVCHQDRIHCARETFY